ncbi:hypothetical protein D3C76_1725370 [compost metagenome]
MIGEGDGTQVRHGLPLALCAPSVGAVALGPHPFLACVQSLPEGLGFVLRQVADAPLGIDLQGLHLVQR